LQAGVIDEPPVSVLGVLDEDQTADALGEVSDLCLEDVATASFSGTDSTVC